jgi:hypothetical protein
LKAQEQLDRAPESDKKIEVEMEVDRILRAAHELVALSPEQALPVAVVWLKR